MERVFILLPIKCVSLHNAAHTDLETRQVIKQMINVRLDAKKKKNNEFKQAQNHCRAAEVIQVKVKMLFRISLVSKYQQVSDIKLT